MPQVKYDPHCLSYIKARKSVMKDNGEVIRTWFNVGVILIIDDSKLRC